MKGLLLLNNKVEDVEALATRALLVRSGFKIDTFTLEDDLTITTAFGLSVKVDLSIKEVNDANYDFIILPGGGHVFNWINKSSELTQLINKFNDDNKLISAICAAPLFLNNANLLLDKEFTAFPDVSKDIKGIYKLDAKVVKSGNIITARSAGVVYDFTFEIINYLNGLDKTNWLKSNIYY